MRNKTADCWIEIGDDSWRLINYMGEEADGGKMEINGDKADLYDKYGYLYITVSTSGDGTLFDETYQEDYSAVDALPDFDVVTEFDEISGDWIYEKINGADLEDFESYAYVHVTRNGDFTVNGFDEEEGENTGIITYAEDVYEEGYKGSCIRRVIRYSGVYRCRVLYTYIYRRGKLY